MSKVRRIIIAIIVNFEPLCPDPSLPSHPCSSTCAELQKLASIECVFLKLAERIWKHPNMSRGNGRNMEIKTWWPTFSSGWIGTRTVNFLVGRTAFWYQQRFFEHCLRIECSLVDTGRMPSATKSLSSWKRRRPSNSPSMKDGIPKQILKSLDGISAILKTNFNVSIQHSHILIPSSKSQIGINRIKEEDRWGKATVSGFGRKSCQARIDSINPKVWWVNKLFFVQIPPGRRNGYDGEFEYWVVVKETAKRTEESSYEEQHRKTSKA